MPIIEQAYDADRVDWTITGDWDDVQVEFGLKEPDPNKKRPPLFPIFNFSDSPMVSDDSELPLAPFSTPSFFTPSKNPDRKKKNKRKQADKTRKMNRKRNKR